MFTRSDMEDYGTVVAGVRRRTLCFGDATLMTEFRLQAGHALPRHAHAHEQTGYLVSGHIALAIADETHDVTPGDSWCIPGGVSHGAEVLEDSVAVEVFSPVREDFLPDWALARPRGGEAGEGRRSGAPVAGLRQAETQDLPLLVELMADFYAESGYVLDRERATAAFAALLADDGRGRVWLLDQAEEPVGYIVVTFVFAMEYGGVTAVVDDFYLRPASRRAGLGIAALAEVRRSCAELGVRAMRVDVGRDNAAAQAVYRRAGLTAVDRLLMAVALAPPSHLDGSPDQSGGRS